MSDLVEVKTISLEAARRVVTACVERAKELGVAVAVAVADQPGNLKAFGRMDGAQLLSSQIAQDKAFTVAAFGMPTHRWWDLIKDEPPLLHGIVKTDRLVIFAGGVPIVSAGEAVGAVGVSGATSEQDRQIAEAGASVVS